MPGVKTRTQPAGIELQWTRRSSDRGQVVREARFEEVLMSRHRPHEGTTGFGKSRTLAWLAAIGLACSLAAIAAPTPQQAPAKNGNQPASSQDKADKAGADKAKADKAKQDAAAAKPP